MAWILTSELPGEAPPPLQVTITEPIWQVAGFSVSVPTHSGRVYALEYKTALTDPAWAALPLVAGNGTNLVLRDCTATNGSRFYRAVKQ